MDETENGFSSRNIIHMLVLCKAVKKCNAALIVCIHELMVDRLGPEICNV